MSLLKLNYQLAQKYIRNKSKFSQYDYSVIILSYCFLFLDIYQRIYMSTVTDENHIETNSFQKALLCASSSIVSLLNPWRHDMIAVFGEVSGHDALQKMYQSMLADPEGVRILNEKPVINSRTVDLEKLSKLDQNSLGYHYYSFLKKNNVTPDTRMPVKFVDDMELSYVMQRYRETHDLVHTILDMPTNMQGEVAVKWVESIQTKLPMCSSGAIFGPLRFKPKQRLEYIKYYLPYAIKVGLEAKPLINIYYEERWQQNIHDLRENLNIDTIKIDLNGS